MKEVVFILSFSNNQNAIKRMEEFTAHGISVEAFGFKRNGLSNINATDIHVSIVGSYDNSKSYFQRIPIIFRGVHSVVRQYRNRSVLYYLFGLDVAGVFRLLSSAPYIYEEEDLIYTYLGNSCLRKLFTYLDRFIVKGSTRTVFTSEGFANFHFAERWPSNVYIIPNKLKKKVIDYPALPKETDIKHLRIAFVGSFRFQSVFNFAKVFLANFPNHSFHFFGSPASQEDKELFDSLIHFDNCVFHGRFKNPMDLPQVYSQIDLLLSTYDVKYENVKYAEPNKLYEAIYYNTPIIVSSNCFLGDKVEKMGVGYSIDALNDETVLDFIKSLTLESINEKKRAISAIDKCYAIDDNSGFIETLKFDIINLL